jgi:hypothetical protein
MHEMFPFQSTTATIRRWAPKQDHGDADAKVLAAMPGEDRPAITEIKAAMIAHLVMCLFP